MRGRGASRARAGALFGAAALVTGEARALEAEVRAETLGQSYQLRGPLGASVLSFRRVTQTLTLSGYDASRDRHGWRLTLRARLRIDSDFGTACDPGTAQCLDEVNRARATEFTPLFARRALDLPWAYLDVDHLAGGALDLRVGRQWVFDPLGMLLFDGARARVHVGERVSVEALGGLETRAGFPLSNGRFSRDGLQFVDRTGWDQTLAPWVEDRRAAWLVGASVDYHGGGRLEARASWRRTESRAGVVEEKAGVIVDLALGRGFRLNTEGVLSVAERRLAWASLALERRWPGRGVLGVELSRSRPTFDLSAIWSSFWIDPTDDLRLHAERALGGGFTLVASVLGRRYALDATLREGDAQPEADQGRYAGGVTAALQLRRPRGDAWLRAVGEYGDVALRTGGDLGGRWWLRPGRVRAELGLSLWYSDDTLRSQRQVASLGVVAAVLVRINALADLSVALEDDMNKVVGHRVRAMGVLSLRGPF
ncbi:MAG: hypothetical protein JNK72_18490 [Myxococcales bacterium]|nr:hypothetical protein [Myxococcales bacterium]